MDSYYEKVSKLLKPPFILNLEKMGFDVYSEVEKVLSHYFDERVYLHDSSTTLSDGEIIDPEDYSLTNKEGLIVYEEDVTADWWSIIKYDDNGNETGKVFKVKEITTEYILLDDEDGIKTIPENLTECFVYGYEVEDYHILTKEYIWAINVSATQELHKIIMEQKEEINLLKEILARNGIL